MNSNDVNDVNVATEQPTNTVENQTTETNTLNFESNYVLEPPLNNIIIENDEIKDAGQIDDTNQEEKDVIPKTIEELQALLHHPKYTLLPPSVQFIVKSNLVKAFNSYSQLTRSKAVEEHLFECIPDDTYIQWIALFHKYVRCCPHLEHHKTLNVYYVNFILEYICTFILSSKHSSSSDVWQSLPSVVFEAVNKYISNEETYDVELLKIFQEHLNLEQMKKLNEISEHQVMDTVKAYRDNIYKVVQTVTFRFDYLRLQAKAQDDDTDEQKQETQKLCAESNSKMKEYIQRYHLQPFQFEEMNLDESAKFMRKMEHTFMELFEGFVQCEEDIYFDEDREKMKELQDQSLNNLDSFLLDIMKEVDAKHSKK
jgi:hypothetical protein